MPRFNLQGVRRKVVYVGLYELIAIAASSLLFMAIGQSAGHSGGMAIAASTLAIVWNLTFNHLTAGNSDQQSVFAAGTERTLRFQDLAALREGDYFSDGKLHDCDGKEVPVVVPEVEEYWQILILPGDRAMRIDSAQHIDTAIQYCYVCT